MSTVKIWSPLKVHNPQFAKKFATTKINQNFCKKIRITSQKITRATVRNKDGLVYFRWPAPVGTDPINPRQYYNDLGETYNAKGRRRVGSLTIQVLHFLSGKKMDELAMGFIHSLRPSAVRIVSDGMVKANAHLWRITVFVDKDNCITEIVQEVEVLLPKDIKHGQAMFDALKYGRYSAQVKWHQDAVGYTDGIGGYCKINSKGQRVPYPEPRKNNGVLKSAAKKAK